MRNKKTEFNCEFTTSDCSCDEQTEQDVIFAVTKILESYNECDIDDCILTNPKKFESKEQAEKRKKIYERIKQASEIMERIKQASEIIKS